jgi:hypothetical protein
MSKIQIQSFSLENYRSISECSLDLSQGAAGLIGVNAAGKTNVGRGADFFFKLIHSRLTQFEPKTGSTNDAALPITQMEWRPLDEEPSAILASPTAGRKLTLDASCRVSSTLITEDMKKLVGNLGDASAYELRISCEINARTQPTGNLRLVPSFDVVMDGSQLKAGSIRGLDPLWKQLISSRIQAMRPASEFLTTLREMRDSGVPGHNAYDRLNSIVQALDPNFARISFVSNGPIAIEGDIPDLTVDNMSSGNLRALQILSASRNPQFDKTVLLHVEEPETHFHPSLQRSVVRKLIDICQDQEMKLLVETHSPHVLAELYAKDIPVYRVEVIDRDNASRTRKSRVAPLPRKTEASRFLNTMGFEAGFAVLGGTVLIVDGVTDVPVYRAFLSQFQELEDYPIAFLPISSLDSDQLDLSEIKELAPSVAVVADGHLVEEHGERLQSDCDQAGLEFIKLLRWGSENFFSEGILRRGAQEIPSLRIADELSLDCTIPLKCNIGIEEFSKKYHNPRLAQLATRDYLEQQADFMVIVDFLQREAALQKDPQPAIGGA